jgi:hypothetical protein
MAQIAAQALGQRRGDLVVVIARSIAADGALRVRPMSRAQVDAASAAAQETMSSAPGGPATTSSLLGPWPRRIAGQ